MTEQEKREKAIEEMVRDYYGDMDCISSEMIQEAIREGGYVNITSLYDKGYRKAEEVRKETAKEILLRVRSFLEEQTKTVKQLSKPTMGSHAIPPTCVECYEGSQDNRLDELSRIAKEFGVEVEE